MLIILFLMRSNILLGFLISNNLKVFFDGAHHISKIRTKYDFKIFSKRKKIVWIGSKTQRIRDEKTIRFGVEYFCYFWPHPFSFCVNPYFPIYIFSLICIMFIQVASSSPYVAQIHTFYFLFSLIFSTFEVTVSFNIFDYNIFDYRQYVNVIACCQNNFVTLISMYVV